ncbi:MAG: hypothetical protein EOM23_06380 [Candidatus Moranbacteria bacterium]|nr:hypothetical protein [Candidatus Moranbacteria bacterium]
MSAHELNSIRDYPSFPEFKNNGFDMSKIDKRLILKLQKKRNSTGIPIIPSPLREGWYRLSGSSASRHYAVNRASDAGDLFVKRGNIIDFWLECVKDNDIGGIGLYFDTTGPDGKPWIMMHIDLRPGKRAMWIRDEGKYYSINRDKKAFWNAFKKVIAKDIG